MPDPDHRDSDPITQDYRAYATSLQERAERAQFAEARESLGRLARWYEVLAHFVERRRNSTTG